MEETPPPPLAPDIPTLQTPLQIGISWLCLAGLVGFLGVVAALIHIPPPESNMQEPGKYLLHTSGKALAAVEALEARGGLFAVYRGVSTAVSGDALQPAAEALEEWTQPGAGVPAGAAQSPQNAFRMFTQGIDRSTDVASLRFLAVVQFERGESDAAMGVLERLLALEDGPVAERIHFAFGGPAYEPDPEGFYGPIDPPWAESILMERSAAQRGDAAGAGRHKQERLDSGSVSAWTLLLVDGGTMVLSVLGIGWILLYALKRPDLTVAGGFSKPPWSAAEGFGVIARGGFLGMLLGQCCCGMLVLATSAAFPVSAIMMGIPALAFGVFYLHRPYHVHFAQTFGLTGVRWGRMLAITFACLCVTFLLQTVVSLTAASLGYSQHWAESASVAPLVTGNWFDATNVALAVSIGAPVGEELLFRAYLYSALRTKFSPLWSIVISAAVFGAVHPYSLVGLIAVGSSGAVWAFAYEKTRSLWPPLLCHALMNFSVTVLHVGMYR